LYTCCIKAQPTAQVGKPTSPLGGLRPGRSGVVFVTYGILYAIGAIYFSLDASQ